MKLLAGKVSPGVVRLTLQNDTEHPVGYNLCASVLEFENGTTWSQVSTDEVCTMQLLSLAAGDQSTFDKHVPAGLQAGSYRYLTSVESPLGSKQVGIASEPITLP